MFNNINNINNINNKIIDNKIIMNRKSLWENFMVYTSYDFQDKWSKLENWDNEFSNFKTKNFLDELIIELYNISEQLLISLKRWSIKKNINYLNKKIESYLFDINIIKSNISFSKKNDKNNDKKINIIESSCFTPPESFYKNIWLKSIKLNNLDDLYEEKTNSINLNSNYNHYENDFEREYNILFPIEI